jgi:hypothetical protein
MVKLTDGRAEEVGGEEPKYNREKRRTFINQSILSGRKDVHFCTLQAEANIWFKK